MFATCFSPWYRSPSADTAIPFHARVPYTVDTTSLDTAWLKFDENASRYGNELRYSTSATALVCESPLPLCAASLPAASSPTKKSRRPENTRSVPLWFT